MRSHLAAAYRRSRHLKLKFYHQILKRVMRLDNYEKLMEFLFPVLTKPEYCRCSDRALFKCLGRYLCPGCFSELFLGLIPSPHDITATRYIRQGEVSKQPLEEHSPGWENSIRTLEDLWS